MSQYYPVMLHVNGRRAIVVGGDRIAAEKAAGLVASGALVEVLSPDFCEEILLQAEHKRVTLRQKAYEAGDLLGAFVVIASTKDSQLIQAIWNETQERGQLVNIVDVPEYCSFITPSVLRRDQLTIAVSTAGSTPGLAKRIRHSLEESFPYAYGPYLRLAALCRTHLRAHEVSYDHRDDFFEDFYTSDILAHVTAGDIPLATQRAVELLQNYGVSISATRLEADLMEVQEHVTSKA